MGRLLAPPQSRRDRPIAIFWNGAKPRMQKPPINGFSENPRPGATLACAFTPAELRTIRIAELDLRALRARRQSIFPMLRRDAATRLADERLEALRALIIVAGLDFTGVALLGAYRTAVEAGIDEVKLLALIDLYWC
jgi:hypothetical protein